MTLSLHGPWQAWAWYVGWSAMWAFGVVLAGLAILAFADLAALFNETLEDAGDQGTNWGGEENHDAPLIYVGEQDHD